MVENSVFLQSRNLCQDSSPRQLRRHPRCRRRDRAFATAKHGLTRSRVEGLTPRPPPLLAPPPPAVRIQCLQQSARSLTSLIRTEHLSHSYPGKEGSIGSRRRKRRGKSNCWQQEGGRGEKSGQHRRHTATHLRPHTNQPACYHGTLLKASRASGGAVAVASAADGPRTTDRCA